MKEITEFLIYLEKSNLYDQIAKIELYSDWSGCFIVGEHNELLHFHGKKDMMSKIKEYKEERADV